ncbi:MAG: hypothetical protein WCW26_02020 [Candidatus Buchananbacteria bacterium]
MAPLNYPQKTKIKTIGFGRSARQQSFFRLRILILALLVFIPNTVFARTYNPNNIITDNDLRDSSALSQTAIQKFLERENSVLARYSAIVQNQSLTAAQMIWQVSQKHTVSPKFILATLEKEQGLIHKTQATEKAFDWATGYGCYSGTCKEKYRGLYNQIDAAAETQDIYWQKAGQFGFAAGKTSTTYDGFVVTPENRATANLFIYTPYVGYSPELGVTAPYGGNRLFWTVWYRYFTDQKFLDGQTITDGQNYWLIQNNKKRLFSSKNLFLTDYKISDAIFVSQKNLNSYPDGAPITALKNSLVKSAVSGQIFLLDENQKRPLIDNEALALFSEVKISLTESEIPSVSNEELSNYTLGNTISKTSLYPKGKLFQDPTGQVWLVKDGIKYPVDQIVWQNKFSSKPAEPVAVGELDQFPAGDPIKLKDGTFVINDGKYYLITAGERVRIMDLEIFNRTFGLDKKENALKVSTALLEIHTAGDMIDYIDDTVKDQISTPVSDIPSIQNYAAEFQSISPEELVLMTQETKQITVKFKNTGTTTWQPGDVWLKVSDQGKDSSSFGANKNINFNETSVAFGQIGTFTVSLTGPAKTNDLINQFFSLYKKNDTTGEKIASTARFIFVKIGETSQITKHNLPAEIKNKKNLVSITIKIKNTGKETWTSKKTALSVYNTDGSVSPFYDKNDWIRKDVAAVPINASKIKPGQTAEFRFILNAKTVKSGTYTLNLQLKLLDKDKQVLLDGKQQWQQKIIVK